MTFDEMDRNGVRVSEYRIANTDISIEERGTGLWAVCDGQMNLNRNGEWEYEPRPSSRTDEFFARCRFSLDEALRRAIEAVSA